MGPSRDTCQPEQHEHPPYAVACERATPWRPVILPVQHLRDLLPGPSLASQSCHPPLQLLVIRELVVPPQPLMHLVPALPTATPMHQHLDVFGASPRRVTSTRSINCRTTARRSAPVVVSACHKAGRSCARATIRWRS